jgi:hypothetical protein
MSIETSSSGSACASAASHFSRATSAPPILRALATKKVRVVKLVHFLNIGAHRVGNPNKAGTDAISAYPARDPPIHAMVAGVNAGDLPELALARLVAGIGGAGLFKIAMYGLRG